ncbi:MAG: hypothetical protein R2698_01450 [Microthrixaceae bacterium]
MPYGPKRLRGAAAVLLCVAVLGGCTSAPDRFCGRLRQDYRLLDLSEAIEHHDRAAMQRAVSRLRDLQDVAPESVFNDMRSVIDALEAAIDAVVRSPDPNADPSVSTGPPIDTIRVSKLLAEARRPAQDLATYADRECGLDLST